MGTLERPRAERVARDVEVRRSGAGVGGVSVGKGPGLAEETWEEAWEEGQFTERRIS